MPNAPYEVYETAPELAARWKVSPDTIERMEKTGDIPPAHIRTKPVGGGRGRCIKRWDVYRLGKWMDGHRDGRNDNN